LDLHYFLGKFLSLVEATCVQHNFCDKNTVGDYHGNCTEQVLKVDRKFRTTSIPRVGGDENCTVGVKV
jgi:hypothetical protein